MRFFLLSPRQEDDLGSVAKLSPCFADVWLLAKSASYALDLAGITRSLRNGYSNFQRVVWELCLEVMLKLQVITVLCNVCCGHQKVKVKLSFTLKNLITCSVNGICNQCLGRKEVQSAYLKKRFCLSRFLQSKLKLSIQSSRLITHH